MFPMSYSERAWLRSLKRQALRQNEVDASRPRQEVTTTPTQTNVSYCNHQCPQHSEVAQANGGDGKKTKDGKGKDGGGEAHPKKDKGKGGKGKGKDKNRDSDDNDSTGSSNDEIEKKPTKDKGKGGKVKDDKAKGDKGEKGKKEEKQSPLNAFLPYPWNSPNFAKIAGGKEQHTTPNTTSLENAVESARRADEECIMRWLAERDGLYVQDALKWLEERDAARLGRLRNLTSELSALNLNLQSPTIQPPWRLLGPATHPLPFNQGLPNVGLPAHHGPYENAPGNDTLMAGRDTSANRTLLASYDENTELRLEDGTKVIIKGGRAPQGFAPPTLFPGSNRPPLQPVDDAAGGRVHWSRPAQAWPQDQAPPAAGPAYRQDHHPQSTDGNIYRQNQPPAPPGRPGFHQSQPRASSGRPRMNQNQAPMQNRPAPDENRKPNKWLNAVESDHGLGGSNVSEEPPWGGSNHNGYGDYDHGNGQNEDRGSNGNVGKAEWFTPASNDNWEKFGNN